VKYSEMVEMHDYRFWKRCAVHDVRAMPCRRVTEDCVKQFLFCRPLAKHTTGKEMFKTVDSFTIEYQLLRTHCVSVCADGPSGMIRIKRAL